MLNIDVDALVYNQARKIGMAESNEWLHYVQELYWRGIKQLADENRLDEVKRFCPGIGEGLITALRNCKSSDLANICFEEFCAMRPVLPEETLVDLLENQPGKKVREKSALQLLSALRK